MVLAVVYLSLSSSPIDTGEGQGDKGLHVLAYAVLTGWFACIYDERNWRRRFSVGFIAMGIALECIQPLTGLREFELVDMVANTSGVLVGWMLAPPRVPNVLQWVEWALSGLKS